MIEYNEILINCIDDYDKILDNIDQNFSDNIYFCKAIDEMKERIGKKCARILIEFPYYDSEYLSSYYIYYIKKFKNAGKECCRLHFFNKDNKYCGYLTLRPTKHYFNFSKSFLNPELLLESPAYLICERFKSHIYGKKYYIEAFPWMNQQRDFSMCGHIAAWSILKYYENSFSLTGGKNLSIGEIVEHLSEQANRKLPSTGLNLQQISSIFKAYNFTPIIIKREEGKEDEFFREVLAYIESGIPVLAASNTKEHVFSIIGHGKIKNRNDIEDNKEFIMHAEYIDELYISDDNYLPYRKIECKREAKAEADITISDIDFAVIPLYNRIHLEYRALYERVKSYIETNNLNVKSGIIVRIYLLSSNKLKEKVLQNTEINPRLQDILLRLEMPKYVWCVDLSTKSEYTKNKVSARIIADSTASAGDTSPWLLVHDDTSIKFYDKEEWKMLKEKIEPYQFNGDNLKGYLS